MDHTVFMQIFYFNGYFCALNPYGNCSQQNTKLDWFIFSMYTHTHRNKHTQGVYEDSNLLWHDCVHKPLYHHDYGGNKFLKNVNYTPVDILLSHDQRFNF
jgi:hypothetical protein